MKNNIQLFLIDCQRCFTDAPIDSTIATENDLGVGSLFVPGAPDDMERLSYFVEKNISKIDDIHLTLDSHHPLHISLPLWWKNPNTGEHPNPFTSITHKDVLDGKWIATTLSLQKWSLEYTKQLEAGGKYELMVWPAHALIGSAGANVNGKLFKSLMKWEEEFAIVDYVTKGSNIYTESYSVLKSEVPRPDDASTQLNTKLIESLMKATHIVVAGQALSHCVRSSVLDLLNSFGDDSYIKKVTLLTDCCSIIPGFEKQTEDFLKEASSRGMQLSTTDKFLK